MPRTLDLSALRSFVAVADTGGVTRAAGVVNLTQSAVSMQIRRLEEALELPLFDRSGRGIALTAAGEQLLSYARRLLSLNDEAVGRLTGRAFEGTVRLGVPTDIVHPYIPRVLRQFAVAFPRVRVNLLSSYTRRLRAQFAHGECDLILTTEDAPDAGGEVLAEAPLAWIGAPGGTAWRQRPLPLAFEPTCIFRTAVTDALDRAGIPWTRVEAETTRAVEAATAADLAVHVMVRSVAPAFLAPVQHGGALPAIPSTKIILYGAAAPQSPVIAELAAMLRAAYCCAPAAAEAPVPEFRAS